MNQEDIDHVISLYAKAAGNALEARFYGVEFELHGANGYLIDQFLRWNSHRRDGNTTELGEPEIIALRLFQPKIRQSRQTSI